MNNEQQRIGAGQPQGAPRDVAEARAAVAGSRAKVSATMDELEEKIVDTREQLQDRLDVVRPVRRFVGASPLIALAAAAGAGLLLGLVTGGRRKHTREIPLDDVDDETIRRWRRERRKRLLDSSEHGLPRFEPPPSRLGRLIRDVVHEFAGAATAMVAAQLIDRVKGEQDRR